LSYAQNKILVKIHYVYFTIQVDTFEIKIIKDKNRLHEIMCYKRVHFQCSELNTDIKPHEITYHNLVSISRLVFLVRRNRCVNGVLFFCAAT
jgi:hypothetical protein